MTRDEDKFVINLIGIRNTKKVHFWLFLLLYFQKDFIKEGRAL